MARADASIIFDTKIDNKGFNKGVQSVGGSFGSLAGTIGKIGLAIASAFAIDKVISFGKEAVDVAAQTESAWLGLQSIVEGTGGSIGNAKSFINDYVSDGLVPLNNAVTAYKNLTARGYDEEQVKSTMLALKDAAAFGRQASLSMGDAVQSASEGLKNENSILVDNAGVTKNVSKMWQDYANSIGTTVANLTQQQKIQAEVNGILEETKHQVGDAALYSETYAGQTAQLGAAFVGMQNALGQAIIPILQAIIPHVKSVIEWLTTLFNTFAVITRSIFGGAEASKAQAKSLDNSTASTKNMTRASKKLEDQTKKTTKATKLSLASFDELNTLSNNSYINEGGGSDNVSAPAPDYDFNPDPINIPVGFEIDEDPKVFQWLIDAFNFVKDNIYEIIGAISGFILGALIIANLDKIIFLFKEVGAAVSLIFGDGIKKAGENFNILFGNKIKKVLKDLASKALIAGGAILVGLGIGKIVQAFKDGDKQAGAFGVALVAIGAAAITAGMMIKLGMESALGPIGWVLLAVEGLAAGIAIFIGYLWDETNAIKSVEDATLALEEATTNYNDAVNNNITAIDAAEKAEKKLAEAETKHKISGAELQAQVDDGTLSYKTMTEQQRAVYAAYRDNISKQEEATKSTEDLTTSEKDLQTASFDTQLSLAKESGSYDEYKKSVIAAFKEGKLTAEEMRDKIGQATGEMSYDTRKTFLEDMPSYVKDGLNPNHYKTNMDKFKASFSIDEVADAAKTVWKGMGIDIDKYIDGFKNKGTDLATFWNGIFSGIGDFFKGVINNVIDGLNKFNEGVEKVVNNLVNNLNKVTGFLGIPEIKTISIQHIPRLATGAVIPPNSPFLAVLGDQKRGTNIETPLDTMVEAFNIAIASNGGTGGNQPIIVQASGDTGEIVRLLRFEIVKEEQRVGGSFSTRVS
jgi:Kef-type K+ transport systems, membrane components